MILNFRSHSHESVSVTAFSAPASRVNRLRGQTIARRDSAPCPRSWAALSPLLPPRRFIWWRASPTCYRLDLYRCLDPSSFAKCTLTASPRRGPLQRARPAGDSHHRQPRSTVAAPASSSRATPQSDGLPTPQAVPSRVTPVRPCPSTPTRLITPPAPDIGPDQLLNRLIPWTQADPRQHPAAKRQRQEYRVEAAPRALASHG